MLSDTPRLAYVFLRVDLPPARETRPEVERLVGGADVSVVTGRHDLIIALPEMKQQAAEELIGKIGNDLVRN